MKKILWTLFVLILTNLCVAQKENKASNFEASPGIISQNDSIPVLPDSVEFISNRDLELFIKMLKQVMTHPQYVQAGDVITQYEMIVSNTNQIFIAARKRWEEKNKIKKTVK